MGSESFVYEVQLMQIRLWEICITSKECMESSGYDDRKPGLRRHLGSLLGDTLGDREEALAPVILNMMSAATTPE